MANSNAFIHNTGLNKENSLTHLLDAISPDMENEVDLVQSSKYYDDESFKIELNSINNRLCILSLNCQSINAKYEKLKLFLDDVNTQNPISVICIQESWAHEEMDIDGHESKPANSNFSKKLLFDKFEGNTFLHNVLKKSRS